MLKFLVAAGIAPLVLGIGAAGLASAGGSASATEPTRCEIRAVSAGGMTSLEGLVHAAAPVSGSYSFRIRGGGSAGTSNIQQGGEFYAAPGEPALLGSVSLGGRGARYDASLTVTIGGRTLECHETIGAI